MPNHELHWDYTAQQLGNIVSDARPYPENRNIRIAVLLLQIIGTAATFQHMARRNPQTARPNTKRRANGDDPLGFSRNDHDGHNS
ncbi:hypothetical protein SAMN02799620_04914 [Mycolicibacterium fluoranthenivorans]|uniref:Uncharacterized protein n=1 Tax=Mycolicibacterium fluoranthenivorans TaxID=258505 RepID=A0A1G4WUI6_9MYCO|nr:hypothetical protein SAMN02799620_04914 [Mycolicibacterium fluoranthenivorans]